MSSQPIRSGAALLLCLLALAACRSRAMIDSVPRGATVMVGGETVGTTPVMVDTTAYSWWGYRRRVTVSHPGFRIRTGELDTRWDARHLWLSPVALVLPPLLVHPAVSMRLKDYYLIVLDEDLTEGVEKEEKEEDIETFYGRVFEGTRLEREGERQRILIEGGRHDG